MKVTDKKGSISSTSKTGNASAAKKTSSAGGNQSTVASKAGVSVALDSKIAETLKGNAEVRAARVAELKVDYDSDNMNPDSTKTAEKLLQNLTDYPLA